MEIRKDFLSVDTYLHRLSNIGLEFRRHDLEDWSHLKNREDFNKIYLLESSSRLLFERIYEDGRSIAGFMKIRLREFNDAKQFPTLMSYVDSFERTWVKGIPRLEEFLTGVKHKFCQEENVPWAVQRMAELYADQISMLEAVNQTLGILKQTRLYRIEKGEVAVDSEQPFVSIGSVAGSRVNINSTDNSVNVRLHDLTLFAELRDAIDQSSVEPQEKEALLRSTRDMEEAAGSPSFLAKYQQFIQDAANHTSIIAPFLPALSRLLGV